MRTFGRLIATISALAGSAFAAAQVAPPSDAAAQWTAQKPNIVYILCDDLGIGDVHYFNPERGKIATPNMDRLAGEGMSFRDAHSASAVCTPSRYSILTGRYNWRSTLQKGVLTGSSKPLIEPGRMTVASLLKSQGYTTQAFGKWHLGMQYGADPYKDPIIDGPLQHGFDHFFGVSASLDMPPFAFIDDARFPELPTVTKKWLRSGPAAPSFEAVDVLPTLVQHTQAFIQAQATAGQAGGKPPFFMYLALTSPHTPIVPSKQFAGKSGLGAYGDFVMETDWALGQVLQALDAAKLTDSTLIIFTSDNGCSPAANVKKLEAQGHYPSAEFRGYKADIWDGGHRIPFIVRWPGVVAAGSKSDQTVEQLDLMATAAQIVGVHLPDNAGEDSFSMLSVLRGTQQGSLREAEVHHSIDGDFAIRQGNWKLELCAGSGGWSAPREPLAHKEGLPIIQLYDLATDIGETHNVQADHPDVVKRLLILLQKYIDDGRSTPGAAQKNDQWIDLWKIPSAKEQAAAKKAVEND